MPQDELVIDTSQLDAMMDQFPHLADEIRLDFANQAARAGAEVIFDAMEVLAPTRLSAPTPHSTALRPGAVREDLGVRPLDNKAGWLVGPGSLTAYVVRWLEFGHRLVKGKHEVGTVEPHPFIRNAYDASESAAGEAAQVKLAELIQSLFNRLKGQVKKVA